MNLDIEIWKVSETQRRYLSDSLALTNRNYPISWFKGKTPEELDLSEGEENLAVGIFTIIAIKAATIWPSSLDVQVEGQDDWAEVEPAVLAVLQSHTGAEEVSTFDSPQNMGEY